eukprot:TRINITY_DN6250_c0_g1_i1.p1 TRINITY_DN6250_c0_g1~~TRINITY_DN6250_c0_g1_i1.p1  ORF type:complete len:147 (-),score=24.49 TRINITY_DN6250_c0_g1_i1:292-732(-)
MTSSEPGNNAKLTSAVSDASVSSDLKYNLRKMLADGDQGPRFLKVVIEGGTRMVSQEIDAGLERSEDWRDDFEEIQDVLEEDEPCFIVFSGPPELKAGKRQPYLPGRRRSTALQDDGSDSILLLSFAPMMPQGEIKRSTHHQNLAS